MCAVPLTLGVILILRPWPDRAFGAVSLFVAVYCLMKVVDMVQVRRDQRGAD